MGRRYSMEETMYSLTEEQLVVETKELLGLLVWAVWLKTFSLVVEVIRVY